MTGGGGGIGRDEAECIGEGIIKELSGGVVVHWFLRCCYSMPSSNTIRAWVVLLNWLITYKLKSLSLAELLNIR